MSHRFAASLSVIALLTASCQAVNTSELSPEVAEDVTRFKNAQVFDGEAFVARDLCVSDALIVDCPSLAGDEVDVSGTFITPPFGDAHTHHFDGPYTFEWHTGLGLDTGAFYAMTMTAPNSGVAQIRDRFRGADRVDVATSLGGITGPESHPAEIYEALRLGFRSYEEQLANVDKIRASKLSADNAYYIVESEEDVDAKLALLLEAEPDHIKIYLRHSERYSEGWGKWGPGGGIDPDLAPYITSRAREEGLRTAFAVSNVSDFEVSLVAGADLVTHLPCYQDTEQDPSSPYFDLDAAEECLITKDQAQRAGASGMVSTLIVSEWENDRPQKYDDWEKQNIAQLSEAGAPLAVAVDSYGRTLTKGLIAGVEEGFLSAPDLLRISTMDTPKAIFPDRTVGCLDVGCEASFIGFNGDPLVDINVIDELNLRVKDGVLFE